MKKVKKLEPTSGQSMKPGAVMNPKGGKANIAPKPMPAQKQPMEAVKAPKSLRMRKI